MTPDRKSKRGRPKGTGLDDRSHLAKISGLLAADPDLKPTTAIKQLGVNDPSAIRRLREKLKEMQQAIDKTSPPQRRPRTAALNAEASAKLSEAIPESESESETAASSASGPQIPELSADFNAWLTYWGSISLQSFNTSMEMTQLGTTAMLNSPAVLLALQQSVAATGAVLAMTRGPKDSQK